MSTYKALIRRVMGIAEMKATSRFEAETRTPICQSLTKPGGMSALSIYSVAVVNSVI